MYNLTISAVIKALNTDPDKGLRKDQIDQLRNTYGENKLIQATKVTWWELLFKQFIDPIVIILLGASVVSMILGEVMDGSIILAILVMNALLGWFQEFKAEKALDKLQSYSISYAKTVRDGVVSLIPTGELVPGDIVLLESWDLVPADLRLIESSMLQIQEAILTGESTAEIKQADAYIEDKTPLWDRITMAFMGTSVTVGTGKWVVTATGMQTELGHIANLLQHTDSGPSPLTVQLQRLSKTLGFVVLALIIIIMIEWLITWNSLWEMFLTSVWLAVSAIPEWLPAIITITLALGVQKMLRVNVLVRDLKAIETLGSISVICTDKTWTLTTNKMVVTEVVVWTQAVSADDKPSDKLSRYPWFQLLLEDMVHCNNSHLPNVWDPTELALLEYWLSQWVKPTLVRLSEIPFTSESKYQITIHDTVCYIKWAPEQVLKRCTQLLEWNKPQPLTENAKKAILDINNEYASQGKRVLACGYANYSSPSEEVLKDMIDFVYVGLVVMMDPPREEVSQSIQDAYNAGIKVIMITGDNLITAKSIGSAIGLVWNGHEWSMLDSHDPKELLQEGTIFARVNPSHKVLICKTLQELWHRVVMTGDGVNDAPALKQSDVGVAMAITGSDVSKEVADIVLIDDNFSSIVKWVKEWRIIYNNIKNFVTFLLAVNFDEIMLIMISIMLGWPLPMTAIQILWINLVTDGLPTVTLWFDRWDEDVMSKPPRSKYETILTGKWSTIIAVSVISMVVALFYFQHELSINEPLSEARTALVTISVMVELLMLFSIRAGDKPFWKATVNRYLIWAVLFSMSIHIWLIYSPRSHYFGMSALDLKDWIRVLGLSVAGMIVMEIWKALKNRKATQ